jgi:hypothetical protein
MPDLDFRIDAAASQRRAEGPAILFKLHVAEAVPTGVAPTPIVSVALRCQVRVEPGRRRYSDAERARLVGLFGPPERWGRTLRPIPWARADVDVSSFTGERTVGLAVACGVDPASAFARYVSALDEGESPLGFLFSGMIFYESREGPIQVAPISWNKEAAFRLPVATWRELGPIAEEVATP